MDIELCKCTDHCRQLNEACQTLERILLEHPRDMFAIRLIQDCYFHLGQCVQLRDCIARILPEWSKDMPQYGYLLGMYSFGLCETHNYDLAEKTARQVRSLFLPSFVSNFIRHSTHA